MAFTLQVDQQQSAQQQQHQRIRGPATTGGGRRRTDRGSAQACGTRTGAAGRPLSRLSALRAVAARFVLIHVGHAGSRNGGKQGAGGIGLSDRIGRTDDAQRTVGGNCGAPAIVVAVSIRRIVKILIGLRRPGPVGIANEDLRHAGAGRATDQRGGAVGG